MIISILIITVLLTTFGCSDANANAGASGTADDPILVYNAQDLNNVRNNMNVHYRQMADIDLVTFENWDPIGTTTNPFRGAYDGNGFSISNMTITVAAANLSNPIGLFGYTDARNTPPYDEARLQDITLVDPNISQEGDRIAPTTYDGYIGLIAGKIMNTIIENCASINGVVNTPDHQWVGGIVGHMSQGCEVNNSSANALTLTAKKYAGGIAGIMEAGLISESYVTGTLTATELYSTVGGEGAHIGGLVGYLYYNTDISDCYVQATVTGDAQYVGGLIGRIIQGYASYELTNSYFKGSITTSENVYNNSTNKYYGGVAGYIDISVSPTIQDLLYYATYPSEADTQTAGGGYVDQFDIEEVTDSQLKASTTYEGDSPIVTWDFTNTWALDASINDGYPYLTNNPPTQVD
jgi:hypothetical protein